MKKLVLSLLAVLALCGCSTAKEPKIEVKNQTINATVGQMKSEFKGQVCEAVALYDAEGNEVSCDSLYYTTVVSTAKAGEFDLGVAFKSGEATAEATLTLVVTEAE